jgi:cytidylate kinase
MGCGASTDNKKAVKEASADAPTKMTLSWEALEKQDDVATKLSLEFLMEKEDFKTLAKAETADILGRDEQDAAKLKEGIKLAQDKGVLEKITPAPYTQIDVLGKSAVEVADEMIKGLGDGASKGCVLVLVGLSGTGKGTTVDKLKSKLDKAVTWSNGNVFRCLTKLCCDYAEKEGVSWEDKDAMMEKVLTPENLKSFMERIKFDKFKDIWDVELTNLDDTKIYVSEVANTVLKEPRISKTIPTVAGCTQGEVVLFAADACTKMGSDGSVVIVEGREDTVNFIPTPYRFCLTLSDTTIIGARRAGQRVVGTALKDKKEGQSCEEGLSTALEACK